jgi:hypothetical protein
MLRAGLHTSDLRRPPAGGQPAWLKTTDLAVAAAAFTDADLRELAAISGRQHTVASLEELEVGELRELRQAMVGHLRLVALRDRVEALGVARRAHDQRELHAAGARHFGLGRLEDNLALSAAVTQVIAAAPAPGSDLTVACQPIADALAALGLPDARLAHPRDVARRWLAAEGILPAVR